MNRFRAGTPTGFSIEGVNFHDCDPLVKVVGSQVFHGKAFDEYLEAIGSKAPRADQLKGTAAEVIVESAGRDCYLSNGVGRPTDEYIDNLKAQGHGSVFEHAVLTFKIAFVSRGLTHELVRHRTGTAYSQVSSRYVDPDKLGFVMPHKSRGDKEAEDEFVETCLTGLRAYNRIIERRVTEFAAKGVKRRDCIKEIRGEAREHLPIGLHQVMTFTANARMIRHIMGMRAPKAAETQIQAFARVMLDAARPFMPLLLDDWTGEEWQYDSV